MLTTEQISYLKEVGYTSYIQVNFGQKDYENLLSSRWEDVQDSVNEYINNVVYSEETTELIEETENGLELLLMGTFKSTLGIATFLKHYGESYLHWIDEVLNNNYNYEFEFFLYGFNSSAQGGLVDHVVEMQKIPSVYNM